METLKIRFQGKLASSGRMHFYEYGRYQYATARFLSTLEHFRRTGTVASRITGEAKIDIYISVPEEGSFLETIVIPKLAEAAAGAVSASLTTLISYVWHMLLPRAEETESDLIKIARIQLDVEKEKSKQSESLAKIIETQSATTKQALDLVKWAIETPNTRLGDQNLLGPRLNEMQQELLTEHGREELYQEDMSELEKIDPDELMKLISRTSTIAPEMAIPMKRSADFAEFTTSRSKLPILILDEKTANRVATRKLDPEVFEIKGRVRSYDVDRGVGKFVSPELNRQLNFSVAPALQAPWLDEILAAMKREKSILKCQKFIDRGNLPSSLIFLGIETG